MEILSAVALMAGLLLLIGLLRFPSWLGRVADRVSQWELFGDGKQPEAAGGGQDEALEMTVEWGLFTQAFIQRRLDALAEELDRLDRNPDVFAKAFHTMAARSAYEALLLDASKLSNQPRQYAVRVLDFELLEPSTGLYEELQL